MGKGAYIKITVSLVITLCYVFLFGSTGKIESIGESVKKDVSVPESDKMSDNKKETGDENASDTEGANAPETAVYNEEPLIITFPEYTDIKIFSPVIPFELNGAVTVPAGYSEAAESAVSTYSATETEKDYTETTTTAATTTEATTTEAAATTALTTTELPPPAETATPDTTEETTTAPITEETTPEETENYTEETTTPPETTVPPAVYAGELTVRYTGSGGSVTGDAAEILAQVVMGEIGGGFNEEAIKAQAVAAYTYIKYYNDNGNVPYVAVKTPNDTVKSCVNEVLGQAVYYNGTLIQAVYGASTAGYSSSAKNVWGIDYPYLRSQRCELDSLYDPNYGVKTTFTSEEIRNKVRSATGIELGGDPGTWFAIKDYVDNVYVGSFSIGGQTEYIDSDGDAIQITGRVMREKIMDFGLRSASFEVSYSSDTDKFTFTTYGYGHGVGLSQHGANNLANYWGYDYKEILEFYYPGTVIM